MTLMMCDIGEIKGIEERSSEWLGDEPDEVFLWDIQIAIHWMVKRKVENV